jgi:hypothetical protein
MSIVNRRRIWSACNQLAQVYREKVRRRAAGVSDPVAKAIFDTASNFHMPKTTYPEPFYADLVSAQFVHSWQDVSDESCDLKTYFNNTGALVGISVSFENKERLFGSTKGEEGETLHIPADDWIEEIVVYISKIKMIGEYPSPNDTTGLEDPLGECFIKGLKVPAH